MCDQPEKEPCQPKCPRYTFGTKLYRFYQDVKGQCINVLDTIDAKDEWIKAGAVVASPFVGMVLVRKQRTKTVRFAGPLITTMATSYGCFPEETGNFLTKLGCVSKGVYNKVAENQRRLLDGLNKFKGREEDVTKIWEPQSGFVERCNDRSGMDTHQQFDELLSNREFAYEMSKVGFPRVHLHHDHIWAGDDHDQEIVEMMNKMDPKPIDLVECEPTVYRRNDDIQLKLYTNVSRFPSLDISEETEDNNEDYEEEYYCDYDYEE